MKKILIILLIFFAACKDNIIEPVAEIKFDCSGVYAASGKQNLIQLFIQQTGEKTFAGELFVDMNFVSSFENGKIINDEKVCSFSFDQHTAFGIAQMGFQGKFYVVNNEIELRGLLSGRCYLASGWLMIFDNDQYKFTKTAVAYIFKR